MPQSLAQVLVHIIFSTKDRHPFLTSSELRTELHAYAATVLNALDSPPITINTVDDHLHALVRLSRTHALCEVIQELKTSTSKWLKTKDGMLTKFGWQGGYGAFSVSPSQSDSVRRYIENQEEHHRSIGFQDELRKFLQRHGVEFDERYVWD